MSSFDSGSQTCQGEDSEGPGIELHVFAPPLVLPRSQSLPELASNGMPLGDRFTLPSSDPDTSLPPRRSDRLTDSHVFAHAFRIPPERQPVEEVNLTGGYYDAESQTYVLLGHADGGGTACFVRTTNDGTDQWDRWIDD